jgi:hypothetical protein
VAAPELTTASAVKTATTKATPEAILASAAIPPAGIAGHAAVATPPVDRAPIDGAIPATPKSAEMPAAAVVAAIIAIREDA